MQSVTSCPGARKTGLQRWEGTCITCTPGPLCNVSQSTVSGVEWESHFKTALMVWGKAVIQMPQILPKARLRRLLLWSLRERFRLLTHHLTSCENLIISVFPFLKSNLLSYLSITAYFGLYKW